MRRGLIKNMEQLLVIYSLFSSPNKSKVNSIMAAFQFDER